MPELPDLHVYALNLRKHVLHRPIADAAVTNGRRMNATPAAFAAAARGFEIADIEREGKELFFHLSSGKVFSVHLMLNGQLPPVGRRAGRRDSKQDLHPRL